MELIGSGRRWKKIQLYQGYLDEGSLVEDLEELLKGYIILGVAQVDTFIQKATSSRDFSVNSAYMMIF